MKNKYKYFIIILLGVSIILNISQYRNSKKYKEITNDYVYSSMLTVFDNAQLLDTELTKIKNANQIDNNEEVYKINSVYEKMYIGLLNLRDLSIKVDDKNGNKLSSFAPYALLMSEIYKFTDNIKKANGNAIMKLSQDDIDFINKIKQPLNSIEDIHKKYSYTKGDIIYIRLDDWENIVQELSGLNYPNH